MKTRTQRTFWLNATVCLSGAALMTVELVASRLIARFLGSSLYTWTGVLGVILAGMSLGNYLGGRMADGARNLRGRVAVMFFASGAACLAILWLNGLAGQSPALMGLSWPVRILLHMTWAFLLPATVLGTISPMIAKLAIDRSTQTGRAIGTLYAWNAVGSIAGTFVTGFYLTAWLGSVRIVVSMALVLAALGWLYALAARNAAREGQSPISNIQSPSSNGQGEEGEVGTSRRDVRNEVEHGRLGEASLPLAARGGADAASAAEQPGTAISNFQSSISNIQSPSSNGQGEEGEVGTSRRDVRNEEEHGRLGEASLPLAAGGGADAASAAEQRGTAISNFQSPSSISNIQSPISNGQEEEGEVGTSRRDVRNEEEHGRLGEASLPLAAGGGADAADAAEQPAAADKGREGGGGGNAGVIGASLGLAVFAALFALALLPGEGGANLATALRLRDAPSEPNAIFFAETQYQLLTVTAEPGNPAHRAFHQDKLKHSEIDLNHPEILQYPYHQLYEGYVNLIQGRNAEPLRLLVLGGGGYAYPQHLFATRPGSQIVCVEIDPVVTDAARAAFGLRPDAPIEIVHMDARNYVTDAVRLNRASPGAVPPFDFVICDSISDYTVPWHLTTLEFYEDVRELLKPGGVFIMNTVDIFDSGRFMNAVNQTLRAVFAQVAAVATSTARDQRDTAVWAAADRPIQAAAVPANLRDPEGFRGFVLTDADFADLRQRNGVCVLTDDYAPVENLLAPVVRMDRTGLLNAAVRRGIRAAEKGDLPRAVKAFERALEVAPNDESTLLNLARVHEMADAESAALDVYARLVQLYPANVMARNRAAMILARRGHLEPALEQWSASLDIQPAQPDVLNNLGALALQQGDRQRAILYWQRALAYAPDADILRKNLAAAGAPPAAHRAP